MAKNPQRVNIAAIILIAVGVLALVANIVRSQLVGALFLPAFGLAFIGWGLTQKRQGPLVPGGVLTGLGVGTFLSTQTYASANDNFKTGLVLLCMGLGFLVIIPLTAMIRHEQQRWELVPGLLLSALGLVFVLQNAKALNVLYQFGTYWPVLLIALGVFYLFRNAQKSAS